MGSWWVGLNREQFMREAHAREAYYASEQGRQEAKVVDAMVLEMFRQGQGQKARGLNGAGTQWTAR